MVLTNPGEIYTPTIVGYQEKMQSLTVTGNGVGGIVTLDISVANIFKLTVDGNVSDIAVTNAPSSGNAGGFTLILVGDGTARVFMWGAEFTFRDGAPAIPSTLNNASILTFFTANNGTEYIGLMVIEDTAGLV
jgi:hypothetical protein